MDLLIRLKDLESSHHLRKGNAAVLLPFLDVLLALREDNEAVGFTFVDHLGLRGISARHSDWYCLLGLSGDWEDV